VTLSPGPTPSGPSGTDRRGRHRWPTPAGRLQHEFPDLQAAPTGIAGQRRHGNGPACRPGHHHTIFSPPTWGSFRQDPAERV